MRHASFSLRSISVSCRSLHVINHENINGALGRFEFQPELFLQGSAYGGSVILGLAGSIRTSGIWESGQSIVNGKLQMKREPSSEPGLIDYFLAQDQGQLLCE